MKIINSKEQLTFYLRGTFWHEIGHLVADIILKKDYHSIIIESFEINYDEHTQRTGGKVVIKDGDNKFNPVFTDFKQVTIYSISLISGCLYQTFFFQKNDYFDYPFEKCFSDDYKSGGFKDFQQFKNLINQELKLNLINEETKDRIINFFKKDVKKIFYEELNDNIIFYNGINSIIDKHVCEILKNIDLLKPYNYKLELCKLKIFISEVDSLIENSNFEHVISNTINIVLETFFNCYDD